MVLGAVLAQARYDSLRLRQLRPADPVRFPAADRAKAAKGLVDQLAATQQAHTAADSTVCPDVEVQPQPRWVMHSTDHAALSSVVHHQAADSRTRLVEWRRSARFRNSTS